MDHNPLLEVDEDIAINGQLEVLYLHNTRIQRLNDSVSYLYRLRELWISDTGITSLDPGPCHPRMQPGPRCRRAVPQRPDGVCHTAGRRQRCAAVRNAPARVGSTLRMLPRGHRRRPPPQGCRSCRT
jgi:hypothetical protein